MISLLCNKLCKFCDFVRANLTMFYQVLEDEWKKKTKKLNFFLLSWPKREQMETTKKDSWCDITWCVVPLPKPLLLPDSHEQPQSKNWLRWKTQTDWQIPYQGFLTLEILNVFCFKGSFLQYPHPHINTPLPYAQNWPSPRSLSELFLSAMKGKQKWCSTESMRWA